MMFSTNYVCILRTRIKPYHIFLGVDHGNLANESPDVDQQVVAHIDAGVCDARIENDALAVGFCEDIRSRMGRFVSKYRSALLHVLGNRGTHCSAISGEMQALKKPTPVPNKIKPRMKEARAPLGDAMTCGIAAMRMRM
jgi:hypothetical protein